jgi:CheY-like chemotaxis protein
LLTPVTHLNGRRRSRQLLDERLRWDCVTGSFWRLTRDVSAGELAMCSDMRERNGACTKPIMLIEGDFGYSVAISRVFRELQLLDALVISVDCENALARLRNANGFKPRLILLDLEMSRMSAFSFLKVVKNDESLRLIPIVVLAATDNASEVSGCYGLGVAGYVVKPSDHADLLDRMRAVCGYWALSRSPVLD